MAHERRDPLSRPRIETSSWSVTRVAHLSVTGCFVQCRYVLPIGEAVEFTVTLESEMVTLRGRVVAAHAGAGFAVAFDAMDDTTARIVLAYVVRG